VSGDRILLTDRQDPGCFGVEFAARWSLTGTRLSLSDVDAVAVPCGDRAFFEAASEGIFGSHDWKQIG
jgi:hypothetical protein